VNDRTAPRRVDPWIVAATAALLAVGLANLRAYEAFAPVHAYAFVARQLAWIVLGLGAAALTYGLARRDAHRSLPWAFAVGVGAVALCLLGFHAPMRGVRRWIRLGPVIAQPSELLKLGVAAALARWFGDAPLGTHSWGRAVVGVVAIVSVPVAMVAAQPDLGSAALLVAIALATLLVTPRAGRAMALVAASTALPLALLPQLLLRPYQMARLRAFLDPARYADVSWQAAQARAALAAGRWFGAERSHLAASHLPDAHTDFALVLWANLHGLAGLALALAAYATLVGRTLAVARRAMDRYDLAVVTGVGAMLLTQVTMNGAMALGLAPVVGVSAPLVSYGGSNLVVTLAAIGVVLGVRARLDAAPMGPAAPGPERIYRGAA
jgi:rod shape determining protein RodA